MQPNPTLDYSPTNAAGEYAHGARRIMFAGVGSLFLALGLVGVFLPGLPTTPFLLLTTYFYSRSFPSLNRRLLANPLVGPILQRWNEHHGVTLRVKCIAVVMVATAIGLMLAFSNLPSLAMGAVLFAAAIGLYVIWRLPVVST